MGRANAFSFRVPSLMKPVEGTVRFREAIPWGKSPLFRQSNCTTTATVQLGLCVSLSLIYSTVRYITPLETRQKNETFHLSRRIDNCPFRFPSKVADVYSPFVSPRLGPVRKHEVSERTVRARKTALKLGNTKGVFANQASSTRMFGASPSRW